MSVEGKIGRVTPVSASERMRSVGPKVPPPPVVLMRRDVETELLVFRSAAVKMASDAQKLVERIDWVLGHLNLEE